MKISRTKPRIRLEAVPAPTVAKFLRRDMRAGGCSRRFPLLDPGGLRGGSAVEGCQQTSADGRLSIGVGDLVAEEIGHVENVDCALAKGDDVGRGDVEIEVGDRAGESVEEARPVEAGRL